MKPRLTFIIGCTASGKGGLGRLLAERMGGEIISLDSMKVYRRMNIGTAKPSAEVRGRIPHHLIDVVEPWESFSVARYVEMADAAIADLHNRNVPILVVGGTPLYLRALCEGLFEGPGADPAIRERLRAAVEAEGLEALYQQLERVDPAAAGRIHRHDQRRIERALEVYELTGRPISALQAQWDQPMAVGRRYDCRFIGLRRVLEDQKQRSNERVRRMIDEGLVEEVRGLLAEPQPMSDTARQALGYAEIIEHLEGRCSLAEAVEMIKINTRRLAKAQRTWFKRFADVRWLDLSPTATAAEVCDDLLQGRGLSWSPSPK